MIQSPLVTLNRSALIDSLAVGPTLWRRFVSRVQACEV